METLRILLLEDSPLDAELIHEMLEDDGVACEMVRVETREDFDAALEEDGFDLILADYLLPSFDGLSALKITRASHPDLPFILVSGAVGEEYAVEALKKGATDYVLKHRLGRLAPVVRRAVREAGEHSERRRIEAELEKSHSLLHSVIEGATDAIFVKDARGRYLMVNSACEEIAGKPAEEILGKDDTEVFPREVALELVKFDRRVLFTGEALTHEKQMLVKGAMRTYLTTRTVYRDPRGEVAGTIGIAHDITERKRTEEALNEIREAERSRIARDLHDGVLQDLTYALRPMQGARVAPSPDGGDAGANGVVEVLRRSVGGLRSAVYDLRLEWTGEGSFASSVESLVKRNRRMKPGCEIELEVDKGFPEKLPETAGKELLYIVQEALTNVRRHSRAGHVLVYLGTSTDRLRVEVSDDGRGLDQQDPGGMGTRGMHERAHALGGDLRITSKPGEGTKVCVEMALAGDGRDPEEPDQEVRVLLVEDHASFRQAAASVFEARPGFTVAGQAESLAEAYRVLDQPGVQPVDVGILDLGLPDGYGGELIKELRARNPQAQVLVLSASLDRKEIARAVESGAAGILHKSASIDEVVNAVRRLWAGETLLPLEEVVELMRFAGFHKEQERKAHYIIEQLSPREKEVLQALAEGLDGLQIAERLNISDKTERNHMASIFAKLGVHSRLQALVFALRHEVVTVKD